MYGEGISREGDLLDLAVENKIVEKSGAWFSFRGDRLGQGRENAKNVIKSDRDLGGRIEAEVRNALGLPTAIPEESAPNPPAGGSGPSRKAASKE
jgi:recombination protein RecA